MPVIQGSTVHIPPHSSMDEDCTSLSQNGMEELSRQLEEEEAQSIKLNGSVILSILRSEY